MIFGIVPVLATLVIHTLAFSTLKKDQREVAQDQQWPGTNAVPFLKPGVIDQRVEEEGSGTHVLRVPREPKRVDSPCRMDETNVLAPIDRISADILGKKTSNGIIEPAQQPPECRWARGIQARNFFALEGCYAAMGFAFEVAKCWAVEERSDVQICGGSCTDGTGRSTIECQNCFAAHRLDKLRCQYDFMGISQQCQVCLLDAQRWDDHNCAMQCVDPPTPHCLQCRSEAEERKAKC